MNILEKYIPSVALPIIHDWLDEYRLNLKITKSRRSKFGDFRPKHAQKPARISVNNDLNSYHFLITLVHEIAHAAVWKKYKRKAKPHGEEWQEIYRKKLQQVIQLNAFPDEILEGLQLHLQNVKASTCSDVELYKLLRKFDKPSEYVFLSELEEEALFAVRGGRKFIKGKKRRTRYLCKEVDSKRNYLVSGHAEVLIISEEI